MAAGGTIRVTPCDRLGIVAARYHGVRAGPKLEIQSETQSPNASLGNYSKGCDSFRGPSEPLVRSPRRGMRAERHVNCPSHERVIDSDRHPRENAVEKTLRPPRQTVYWHRDLPPLNAEIVGEHVVEAASTRVRSDLAHRSELWERCYKDLMTRVEERLDQELHRLGGDYAHVLDESVDTRRDDVTGEAWLYGRFAYLLLREPATAPASPGPEESSRCQAMGPTSCAC